MTFARPSFRHPDLPRNKIGFTRVDYDGALSTLCAGCGHDSITSAIIQACFELSLAPHRIAKLSGIGCSSKTPAYFLGNSHGFNAVHGRMPAVATGAVMANRELTYIGISGDGDTASIGMGQFVHAVRRNLDITYITMNNGVYGLTKGQDSATADLGSASRKGIPNPFAPIDLCANAIQLGAGYVGRSFSGDKAQLVPMLKAALAHKGFSFVDVISPCVTFNNSARSTKSYASMRENMRATEMFDFVPARDEITVTYAEGDFTNVTMHDGSVIQLHKGDGNLNVQSRRSALAALEDYRHDGKILTGLLYIDAESQDLHKILNTSLTSLNALNEQELCPGSAVLQQINQSLR